MCERTDSVRERKLGAPRIYSEKGRKYGGREVGTPALDPAVTPAAKGLLPPLLRVNGWMIE